MLRAFCFIYLKKYANVYLIKSRARTAEMSEADLLVEVCVYTEMKIINISKFWLHIFLLNKFYILGFKKLSFILKIKLGSYFKN